jgi:hypothetical protein
VDLHVHDLIVELEAEALEGAERDRADLLVLEDLAHAAAVRAGRLTPALRRLGMRPADAHVVNALVTSALLGWFVFRPMLEAGYRLPARADDSLAQTITLLDHLLDAGDGAP